MQKLQRVFVLEGVSWKEACDIFFLLLPAEEWRRGLLGLPGLMALSWLPAGLASPVVDFYWLS